MAVTLTDNAVAEVRRIIQKNKLAENTIVRLGVKGGGCSGFSYQLDLVPDTAIEKNDRITDAGGLKVVCDSKSYLYLNGMIVDFSDTLMARQFLFKNPNAKTTCGCGTSFGV